MPAQDIHVIPADDRWAVVTESGNGRQTFATQEAAIAAGIRRARDKQVALRIHERDGKIREWDRLSNDPGDSPRDMKE